MKPTKVVFSTKDLEKAFNSLSDKDPTKKAISRAIKSIQEDVFSSRNVKKELIPKSLIDKYRISNL